MIFEHLDERTNRRVVVMPWLDEHGYNTTREANPAD